MHADVYLSSLLSQLGLGEGVDLSEGVVTVSSAQQTSDEVEVALQVVSKREFVRNAFIIATHIRSRIIAEHSNDGVGVLISTATNARDAATHATAALCAGGTLPYVPVDPNDAPARLRRVASSFSGSGAIIVVHGTTQEEQKAASALAEVDGVVLISSEDLGRNLPLANTPSSSPPCMLTPTADAVATIFHTSGSTGRPKPCACGFSAWGWYALGRLKASGNHQTQQRIYGAASPPTFDPGVGELVTSFAPCHSLVLPEAAAYAPLNLALHTIVHARVTQLVCTPAFTRTLAAITDKNMPASLMWLAVGGEALSPADESWVRSARSNGTLVVSAYGLTEGCSYQAWTPVDMNDLSRVLCEGCLGCTLSAEAAPDGSAESELRIDGPQLSTCGEAFYTEEGWRVRERNSARDHSPIDSTGTRWEGSSLMTGDACTTTDEAGIIRLLGRRDGVCKVRGVRVLPEALAQPLAEGLRSDVVVQHIPDHVERRLPPFVIFFEANPACSLARDVLVLALLQQSWPGRVASAGAITVPLPCLPRSPGGGAKVWRKLLARAFQSAADNVENTGAGEWDDGNGKETLYAWQMCSSSSKSDDMPSSIDRAELARILVEDIARRVIASKSRQAKVRSYLRSADDGDDPATEDERTPAEAAVLGAVRDVLEYPHARLSDTFLELGGDSMLALRVCMRLRGGDLNQKDFTRDLGVNLPAALLPHRLMAAGVTLRTFAAGACEPIGHTSPGTGATTTTSAYEECTGLVAAAQAAARMGDIGSIQLSCDAVVKGRGESEARRALQGAYFEALCTRDGDGAACSAYLAQFLYGEKKDSKKEAAALAAIRLPNGRSILHRAAIADRADSAKRIARIAPTLVAHRDNDGQTPLIAACRVGASRATCEACGVMDVAPKRGTSPTSLWDARDMMGRTALYFAALNGHLPCVQFLLENGADKSLRGGELDETPREAAERRALCSADMRVEGVRQSAYAAVARALGGSGQTRHLMTHL